MSHTMRSSGEAYGSTSAMMFRHVFPVSCDSRAGLHGVTNDSSDRSDSGTELERAAEVAARPDLVARRLR